MAFVPAITTSTVLPRFSNAALSNAGIFSFRAPAAMSVVVVVVMSMGDWMVEVEQAVLLGERDAQFRLGLLVLEGWEKGRGGRGTNGPVAPR